MQHHAKKLIGKAVLLAVLLSLAVYNLYLVKNYKEAEQSLEELRIRYESLEEENRQLERGLEEITFKRDIELKYGLVWVGDIDESIVVDLRYASDNNFTGKRIYGAEVCLLTRGTAEKLARVNKEISKDGYRIKVWDAYRPYYVQQILWDAAEDKSYVANPKSGSKHNRGCAVDITLVDTDGSEIEMPTGFDDFSAKASRKYEGTPEHVKENLRYLTDAMVRNGFQTINSEWWHFEDTDWEKHPILNVPLEDFTTGSGLTN